MKLGPANSNTPVDSVPSGFDWHGPSVNGAGNAVLAGVNPPRDSGSHNPEVVNPHNEVAYVQVKTSCGKACRETKPQEEKSNNPGGDRSQNGGIARANSVKALRKEARRNRSADCCLAQQSPRFFIEHRNSRARTETKLASAGAIL